MTAQAPPAPVPPPPLAGKPRRWRASSLQVKLTLLYFGLLALLLALIYSAVIFLMRGSLLAGVDDGLRVSHQQFRQLVGQLALDDPATEAERGADGVLPRARILFPNDVIQLDDLNFFTRDTLTEALTTGTPSERERNLALVRRVQASYRRVVVGLPSGAPLELSDRELLTLVGSPGGQITLTRPVPDAFTDRSAPHRLLVTLEPVQLAPVPLAISQRATLDLVPETLAITYVGSSLAGVEDTLGKLRNIFLAVLLVGGILAVVLAYVVAGRALRPLQEVRRAAERIGGQNLTERVPEPATHDEVQALAQSLNAMLARLEASFEAQRRFTSDASHELRTPVTAISGHASYLLRRTTPGAQERESLHIIRSESERLTNLIASLLELARSDSGALTLRRGPVFSRLLLEELSRELEPLASAQHTALRVGGPDLPFEADLDRLKQVLINLIGNALKAGAKTVCLESSSQQGGREVRLTVRDDGPGIPRSELERLFGRFYRLEDSRSRDQGGAGLGLSIAKSIVEAHGGRIWLESTLGEGTAAQVQLPVGDLPELEDDDVP